MTVGICRHCSQRSKQIVHARCMGGGTYRRPAREYRSSICLSCAKTLLARAPTHAGALVDHWVVNSLKWAVKRADDAVAAAESAS